MTSRDVTLCCDCRNGDTTGDDEKNGKGAGFERMGIGLLRERRQITKDPVVIPWWSGVVGFWGLRGASLSSSSRSSNVEGEREGAIVRWISAKSECRCKW